MTKITLTPEQNQAIETALQFLLDPDKREMAISGHSGTGKTTLVKHLIEAIKGQNKLLKILTNSSDGGLDIFFTATTNRASSVIGDIAGEAGRTVHSVLGLRLVNNFHDGTTKLTKLRNGGENLDGCLLLVDEASMANSELLESIRDATPNTKVIYILDPYQLAPVYENTCPVADKVQLQAKLTNIQRQKGSGNALHPIAALGEKYREGVITGVFPKLVADGKNIIRVNGDEFKGLVNNTFGTNPDASAKILAWTNSTVHSYNDYVRSLHTTSNKLTPGEHLITNKPIIVDRCVKYSTESEVVISHVDFDSTEKGIDGYWCRLADGTEVFVPYEQWRVKHLIKKLVKEKDWVAKFEADEFFADLRPLFSSTVHKSQGGTYDIAFLDLDDIGQCREASDVMRLMYVATTRPRTKLYLYGDLPKKYGGNK